MQTLLIADSGSTKTNWRVCSPEGACTVRTAGINPFMQEHNSIRKMLLKELLPYLPEVPIDAIYFYGAGCTPEKCPEMGALLQDLFPQTAVIEVASDMLGAARALCGHRPGVACILGTGSNSCLFDGKEIVEQVSPLGFILGDEGSGAVLGKRLVGDLLKDQMGPGLKEAFLEEYQLTPANIIRRVYREEYPNRFFGFVYSVPAGTPGGAVGEGVAVVVFHGFLPSQCGDVQEAGVAGTYHRRTDRFVCRGNRGGSFSLRFADGK
jgi:N-acetylglucosamine kinase-like BadF-type ATPase